MSDLLLLDRLLDVPRYQSAVSAVRERTAAGWSHHSWQELQVAVRRAAGHVGERGATVRWGAPRGATQLILDLSMQFAGVVGELTGDGAATAGGSDDPGRLVRLRQEVRPRDPAVVVDGRVIDHGEVAARAERARKRLAPKPERLPEVILSTVDARTEQVLGWGAVWGGLSLVCADAEWLDRVDPTVWVCTPEQWRASRHVQKEAGEPRGSKGAATLHTPTALDRLRGTGSRLRRVFVVGSVPASPPAPRGVEVGPWTL